ncbi:MAG: UvrB/UvrC motif-containing protein [Parachlamydiales bacterium]|nr:UvrB/UvrC motif-containing protein [Parachlamydiales bacterium]
MTDRPLECTECKRPVAVFYTEVVKNSATRSCMCNECPVLQRLIHGSKKSDIINENSNVITGLCCGHCGTSLEAIRTGNNLGCSECYEIFGDQLVKELVISKKLSAKTIANLKKSSPIHIGKAPGESNEMNPSMKLMALNEALNETLSREDYEQAALLRDQIKSLMESSDGK